MESLQTVERRSRSTEVEIVELQASCQSLHEEAESLKLDKKALERNVARLESELQKSQELCHQQRIRALDFKHEITQVSLYM